MTNIPNLLTLLRVLFIPLLVIVFYLPWKWHYFASGAIFGIAALTDILDGYLARRLRLETSFGAFLDPVADKLIVAVALVLLLGENGSAIFAIPAIVIISREILVSALREWMAELGKRASVAVSYIGKVKTVLQMIAIVILLMFNSATFPWFQWLGLATLYSAVILTLWSMILYLKMAWPEFIRGSQLPPPQ
jgi:CDP-diacylglycerol---glycerol-3-phosphate 3-phosphatidyltransferase